MTTATVDITNIEKISDDETYVSKLNNAVGLDEISDNKKNNDNYYYTSGSFNFILDGAFKPETLESMALTQVPFAQDWYLGIVSIHGVIMPVIDILGFVKSQNIPVEESKTNKKYLLKLEHDDYSPIVFRLDSIPQLVNTNNCKNIEIDDKSPKWIKNYLDNGSEKLAILDHQKLFDQLITKQ